MPDMKLPDNSADQTTHEHVATPPSGYALVAAELRRVADALDTLPPVDTAPYMSLSILPEKTVEAVDAVALAVLGKRGETCRNGADWMHRAHGDYDGGYITVLASPVPGPPDPPDPRDAELAELRAQVEALLAKRAEPADLHTGRTTAALQPQPGMDLTAVGHAPGRATVTRHFSFGHGQNDPDTGESLLDKYVTVIAPTARECRQAMLASRFGQEWSMEYAPDTEKWQQWGPRWTEHERIDATAVTQST